MLLRLILTPRACSLARSRHCCRLYSLYSFDVIPVIGQIVAKDRDSYQYLVESILKFPPQPVFVDMIRQAGFTTVGKGWEDLTFGIAAVHSGFKL